jgi:tetratricopeptide (TPR) repeat protein/predicted Ser/Thr protein kinase
MAGSTDSLYPSSTGTKSLCVLSPPLLRRLGHYCVLRELGRGGMGVVYEAEQEHPRRHVALKLLRPGRAIQGSAERFRLEAQAMGQLLHPGIPQVYEAGEHEGIAFLAMELVRGAPLRAWAEAHPSLPERVDVLARMADAVQHAHDASVLHRDLKPSNVLVTEDGQPKVLDFGVAALAQQVGDEIVGTPPYMCPEQQRGEQVDARADVYALGMVASELLLPSDPDLAAIVAQATAQEPEHRTPTAAALAADLRRWRAHMPVHARPAGWSHWAALAVRRHWPLLLAIGLTAGAGAVLAGLWGLWGEVSRARAAREAELEAEAHLAAAEASRAVLRAQGHPERAEAAFSSFAAQAEHRGTRALTLAWMRRAEAMRDAGRTEEALVAWGEAYGSATELALQDEALLQIAQLFDGQRQWNALEAVVSTLETRRLATPVLRHRSALGMRDLASAAKGVEPSLRPILQALARGAPTQAPATPFVELDLEGDGPRELVFYDSREVAPVHAALPGLPSQGGLRAQGLWDHLVVVPPSRLLRGSSSGIELLQVHGRELELVARWSEHPWFSAATADIDGDGLPETYLGTGPYSRHLLRLGGPGEEALATHPHPPTDATHSDLGSMTPADLDGDGDLELVVAAGPWRAYDVRVLEGGAPMRLRARHKLGNVPHLTAVRVGARDLVVASKDDAYPSAEMFGTERPSGAPAGVYLLALEGDELVVLQHLPLARPRQVMPADLDGDGRQDFVVELGEPSSVLLAVQQPDGSFASALVGSTRLLGVAQLDEDPAAELVVQLSDTGAVWTLGAGDSPVPRVRRAQNTAVPLLAGREGRDIAARARALVGMGLSSQAAGVLEGYARYAPAEEVTEILHAAARLWASAGERKQALGLYEGLVAQPDAPSQVLEEAAAQLSDAERYVEARAVLERLARDTRASPAQREAATRGVSSLSEAVAPASSVTVSLAQPLGSGWRISEPWALRRESDGLVLHAWRNRPLASHRLLRTGGRIGLEAELELEHLEVGSGLSVRLLRPDGGVVGEWWLMGSGGGGYKQRRVGCGEDLQVDPLEPGRSATVRLGLELVPALGRSTCRLTLDEVEQIRVTEPVTGELPAELVLQLSSHGDHRLPGGALATARLISLQLVGLELASEPPDPVQEGRRALVEGAARQALSAWGDREPYGRALALAELGDFEGARAALEGVTLDPEIESMWLRTRPTLLGPWLAEISGPDWLDRFVRAWQIAEVYHPELPEVELAMLQPRLLRLSGETEAERWALLARGRALARTGRIDAARASLLRVAEREPEAQLELAHLEARQGQPEQAARWLHAYVDSAEAPEVALDRIGADRTLSDLWGTGQRAHFVVPGPDVEHTQ